MRLVDRASSVYLFVTYPYSKNHIGNLQDNVPQDVLQDFLPGIETRPIGLSMGFLQDLNGTSTAVLQDFNGTSMGVLQDFYGTSVSVLQVSHRSPLEGTIGSYVISMVILWDLFQFPVENPIRIPQKTCSVGFI